MPTVPPSAHPHASTVSSMHGANNPDRMTAGGPAGHQAISRSWAQPGADVCPGRDPVEEHPADHQHVPQQQPVRGGEDREHQIDHGADNHDIADRAEPGTLPQRQPQQQHGPPDDQRPGADAQPDAAREPLVKDVPGVDPQPAEQHHRVADAV